MVNIGSILLLSVFVLDVPIMGNLFLLVAECLLFTVAVLALGLLISTVSNSQQVAMLISLMGLFLPTVMFSGFMFPVENMPIPLQVISNIVPAKWFYYIVKNVMIKGLGFSYVWKETLILTGMIERFWTLETEDSTLSSFKTLACTLGIEQDWLGFAYDCLLRTVENGAAGEIRGRLCAWRTS